MKARKLAAAAALAVVVTLAGAQVAAAHPLGNFTSNTYAGIRVAPDHVAIDYVLDLAEIPTQQTMPAIDTNGDGTVDGAEAAAFEQARCGELRDGLTLEVGGDAVTIASAGGRLTFPPGLAGLSILRLECDLTAATGAIDPSATVSFADHNLADRIGWHEITAVGDGATLVGADVPSDSISDRLRAYPTGRPSLEVREASFSVKPGGPHAASVDHAAVGNTVASVPGSDRATRLFSSLIADHDFTLGFGLVAFGLSMVLGAFHALAPGHGKTVIAAYVVGQRGRLRHAVGIGLAVAVTHTAGVLVLGLALYSSEALAPERIYPILGTASGLLVAGVGVMLLVRVVRALRAGAPTTGHTHGTGPGQHTHAWLEQLEHEVAHERVLVGAGGPPVHEHEHHDHHDHDHDHDHHDHDHHDHDHHDHDHHDHDHHDHDAADDIRWGSLLAMGFAGGMVPSPSAVIVLLGALTLGKAWFGLTLVLAYGAGLALTLLAAGLLLVRARRWLEPRFNTGTRMGRVARYLPLITALAVLGGGLLLAARAIATA